MKTLIITIIFISTLFLVSCSNKTPLTESEQAQEAGMTLQEYRETKDAAARMNMWVWDHMKMDDTDMMENEKIENKKTPIIEEDNM